MVDNCIYSIKAYTRDFILSKKYLMSNDNFFSFLYFCNTIIGLRLLNLRLNLEMYEHKWSIYAHSIHVFLHLPMVILMIPGVLEQADSG